VTVLRYPVTGLFSFRPAGECHDVSFGNLIVIGAVRQMIDVTTFIAANRAIGRRSSDGGVIG